MMDIRDIPFDVIDISSFESLGAPLRLADGSLDWTDRARPGCRRLTTTRSSRPGCWKRGISGLAGSR